MTATDLHNRRTTLAAHPRGDNYDFTGTSRFLGVVCTPNVVWVPLGPATAAAAPGLRAASSLEELKRWLAARNSP